jgi:hypothetical protein
MSASSPPPTIKSVLREFVFWLEASYGNQKLGDASEFAVEPSAGTMALPECALELALSSKRPVLLSTTVPMKPLLAALVLKRAGIKLEQVFQGKIDEDQFEALIDAVGTVIKSSLVIELPLE